MYISRPFVYTGARICMYTCNPKKKVPTPGWSASARRGAARRGAPAARGPVLTTLISALRRRRTSSCAPHATLTLCASRLLRSSFSCSFAVWIAGKFITNCRNYLAKSFSLPRSRQPDFLWLFPTFMFSRICEFELSWTRRGATYFCSRLYPSRTIDHTLKIKNLTP